MPLNMVILAGLPAKDTGSASGLLQCLQQPGTAIGVPVLTTLFGTSMPRPANAAHAIVTALIVAAAFSGQHCSSPSSRSSRRRQPPEPYSAASQPASIEE